MKEAVVRAFEDITQWEKKVKAFRVGGVSVSQRRKVELLHL